MRIALAAVAGLVAAAVSTQASAASVVDGTVSSVALFNPTINLSTTPSTYSAINGSTFQISGTGGFANVNNSLGTLNGTLSFSNSVGTTIAQSLANFFVFSDASGGTYNYSVSSVRTNSFVNEPGFSSGTLYVLGSIVDSNLNLLTARPASLSIQFNSTGGSANSSALTLAVPPAAVPESASWAMMIIGMGAAGVALRRRRGKVTTSVAFS